MNCNQFESTVTKYRWVLCHHNSSGFGLKLEERGVITGGWQGTNLQSHLLYKFYSTSLRYKIQFNDRPSSLIPMQAASCAAYCVKRCHRICIMQIICIIYCSVSGTSYSPACHYCHSRLCYHQWDCNTVTLGLCYWQWDCCIMSPW